MAGKQADIKVGVITNYDDKGLKQATTGLSGFKTSISEAEGFTGKFKAGIGSLGSSLKSFVSSPGGMLAAGGAIAAAGEFALHAVGQFSELGVEVGKLADATGLTSEAASRWKEVAGDIGIESGTLESSIGKLNKTLGANPQLFKDAGIEIARTKDGAIDVNETFLNTVDALNGIENPAKKAELATKLLGKGWQSMAELIGEGSGALKSSLAEVSDAKVFDDDKIEKARAFRDATDDLKDVMEDFTLEVGEKATPALIGLAQGLKMLPGIIGSILGPIGDLAKGIVGVTKAALDYIGIHFDDDLDSTSDAGVRATESFASLETRADRATTGILVLSEATGGLRTSLDKTTAKTDKLKEAIAGVDLAYQGLTGKLDEEDAWEHVNEAISEFNRKHDDAGNKIIRTAEETRNLTRDIADYVVHTDTIPESKKTEILALLDEDKIAEAEQALANLTRQRDIYLTLTGPGAVTAAGYQPGRHAKGGRIPMSEGLSLVGEDGPELISAPGSSVATAGQTADLMGGGPTNITFIMPVGSNGNDIIREIKKFESRNGPGWRGGPAGISGGKA